MTAGADGFTLDGMSMERIEKLIQKPVSYTHLDVYKRQGGHWRKDQLQAGVREWISPA